MFLKPFILKQTIIHFKNKHVFKNVMKICQVCQKLEKKTYKAIIEKVNKKIKTYFAFVLLFSYKKLANL